MGKSVNRVKRAAVDLGLDIAVITLPDSSRTAQQAADACKCDVAQIAKSMIFEGATTGTLTLVLVSGAHQLDLTKSEALFGEPLQRADPNRVRKETGFAIGGVAPIGHLCDLPVWMDATLLAFDQVWAAAGAPETVFEIAPGTLRDATQAHIFTP